MSFRLQLLSWCRRGWNGRNRHCGSAAAASFGSLANRRLQLEPLEQRQLLAAFALTGPVSQTYTLGQAVPITWTASSVASGAKISLCYDRDAVWGNGNESWIEVDKVAAANGSGSYSWSTAGIKPGTYYIGGYLYSGGSPTYSHLAKAITIQSSATSFMLTSPSSGTFAAGNTVDIQWTAGNAAAGSVVGLCYDVDTTFNGNENWITVDQAATSGSGTYHWDTTGVQSGTYYIGGYLYSNNSPTYSHFLESITITKGATPTFGLSAPDSGQYTAGDSVSVKWTAGSLATNSTVSLCIDPDKTFNGNEKWIAMNQAASNGDGVYTWDTANVTPGTYYIAGYAYSAHQPTYSHLTTSFVIKAAPAPTLSMTDPASGSYTAGDSIPIKWTAGNVPSGSIIGLCYDPDKIWNGNEKWITVSQSVSSGAGTYNWNSAGVKAGTYYTGGYLYVNGRPTYSHLSTSFSIGASLTLAADQPAPVTPLSADEVLASESQLTPIITEAERRWAASGRSLTNVSVKIADLPGNLLGEAIGNTVYIDTDAAGYGWFIDPTPADNAEFAPLLAGDLSAKPHAAADRHADLLTTVMHELGHVLGYQDVDSGLMGAKLSLGVRWPAAADEAFAQRVSV
ncbi:MAG: hypothetical protein ABFC96_03450 [Thermoguttaceae bacterium]